MAHHVTSEEDYDNQLETAGGKLVVVDFYATWCGPCKMIAPQIDKMANEMPNVIFLKVDVDEVEEVAGRYGITAMPTFIFFKNKEKIETLTGANSDKLKNLIATLQ